MKRIWEMGKKAVDYIRVISGYEKRRILSDRPQLDQRLRNAQERKEVTKKISEQVIHSNVSQMVDETENLNKKHEEMESGIDEYIKSIHKDVGGVVKKQKDREKPMGVMKQVLHERAGSPAVSEANCGKQAKKETLRSLVKLVILKESELQADDRESGVDKDVGVVMNMKTEREKAKVEMITEVLLERAGTRGVSEANCGEQAKMQSKKSELEAAKKESVIDDSVKNMQRGKKKATMKMMKQAILERAGTQAVSQANSGEQPKKEILGGLNMQMDRKKAEMKTVSEANCGDFELLQALRDLGKPGTLKKSKLEAANNDVETVMNTLRDKEKAAIKMMKQAVVDKAGILEVLEANCGEQTKMENCSRLFKPSMLKKSQLEVAQKETDVGEYVKPIHKDVGGVVNMQMDGEKAKVEMTETQAVSGDRCGEQPKTKKLSSRFKK